MNCHETWQPFLVWQYNSTSGFSRFLSGTRYIVRFQAGHWFQCQLCHTLQETHRLFIHAKDAHDITDIGQATALCISPPLMAAAAADAMNTMQGDDD